MSNYSYINGKIYTAMKKEYVKPEIIETILLHENLMLATSETMADDSVVLSNGRRGKWGNLWYDEE